MKIKSDNIQSYITHIGMHVYIYMKKIYDPCGRLTTLDNLKKNSAQSLHSDKKEFQLFMSTILPFKGIKFMTNSHTSQNLQTVHQSTLDPCIPYFNLYLCPVTYPILPPLPSPFLIHRHKRLLIFIC